MSLSRPKVTNPCKKFIEFKGDTGIFQYWEKGEQKGEGKNVEVKKPFTFIVLDELSTISGFSDEYQCGIYSNEVHSLTDEVLNIRLFKGRERMIGKYVDLKGEISRIGGRFTKSVYAALIHGEELELVNLQLKGISFKSWVDSVLDKQGHAVTVEEQCLDGKKGKVVFKIPVYVQSDIPKNLMEKAILMDKALQAYLKEYQQSQILQVESETAQVKDDPKKQEEDDNVPF